MSGELISTENFVQLPLSEARATYLALRANGHTDEAEERRYAYRIANQVSLTAPVEEAAGSAATASGRTSVLGWIVFAIGLLLALWAFGYDPSYDDVVNMGKLNIQLMMSIFGSALMIVGTLFITRSHR